MKNGKFVKFLSLLLAVILVLSVAPLSGLSELFAPKVSAETEGPYTYQIVNGEVRIISFDKSVTGDITIPPSLGGYPVRTIFQYAFAECKLTGVTIPDTVTFLDVYSFRNSTSLARVVIPGSVWSIGNSAFEGCSALTDLTLSDGIQIIGRVAFYECTSLATINIPDSVISIGSGAFWGTACYDTPWEDDVLYIGKFLIRAASLLSNDYKVKDGTLVIADMAFYDKDTLTSVTMPSTLKSIGHSAFSACTSLTKVYIPKSVQRIGAHTFSDCGSLTDVFYGGSVSDWNKISIGVDNDCLHNAAFNCGIQLPEGYFYYTTENGEVTVTGKSDSVVNLTIPKTINGCPVTKIGENAFYNDTSLKNITLPHTVTYLGDYAFKGCSNLYTLYYCGTQDEWNDEGFYKGKQNERLVLHAYHFYGVDLIEGPFTYNIEIVNEIRTAVITDVDDSKISGETVVPDNIAGYPVTEIGTDSFAGLANLTGVVLPKGILSIGETAFHDSVNLKKITVPNTLTGIGNNAFINTGLTDVYYAGTQEEWNENVTVNDNSQAFQNATKHFEQGLFGPYTYSVIDGNAIITNVEQSIAGDVIIPHNLGGYPVVAIGHAAFVNCTLLAGVTVPDSVTAIYDSAFLGCTSLTEINLPEKVLTIGTYAFSNTGYYNDDSNWDEFGVLYIGKHLIRAKTTISGEYEIREGTLSIAAIAFDHCENLTAIVIPEGVTAVGFETFLYCSSLTDLTLPKSVTHIGNGAFSGTALANVYYAGTKAEFDNITFGSNGDIVKDANIIYTAELPEATYYYTVDENGNAAITDVDNLTASDIAVPNAFGENPVTAIGDRAYAGLGLISTINVHRGIARIGDGAFAECENLRRIYFDGSKAQWEDIDKVEDDFSGVIILFTAEKPEGKYYYAVNDEANAIIFDVEQSMAGDVIVPHSFEGYPVVTIELSAFVNCTLLTGVTLPDSVTTIYDNAFGNCTALTEINLPEKVLTIGEGAFGNTGYYNDDSNWDEFGVLYIGKHLIRAKTTISGEYEIREGTLSIAAIAFDHCENLTAIVIPEGVTAVGFETFLYCSSLTDLTLPKSVTHIGNGAFRGTALANVYYAGTKAEFDSITYGTYGYIVQGANIIYTAELPGATYYYTVDYNGKATITDVEETVSGNVEIPAAFGENPVTQIGNGAFADCGLITSVTIPKSIKIIYENAFDGCDALANVYYMGTQAEWDDILIYDGNNVLLNKLVIEDYSKTKLPGSTSKTAKYKNNVTVQISATGIPKSGFLVVDGKKIAPDVNGRAVFEAQFQAAAGRSFKAHIEDKEGNVKVAQQEYKVIVDTGFFAKLSAFFTDFLFNGFKWRNATIGF